MKLHTLQLNDKSPIYLAISQISNQSQRAAHLTASIGGMQDTATRKLCQANGSTSKLDALYPRYVLLGITVYKWESLLGIYGSGLLPSSYHQNRPVGHFGHIIGRASNGQLLQPPLSIGVHHNQ